MTDPDANFVWIDVEFSVNGGGFQPARPTANSERTFAVSSNTPQGASHTFTWDTRADLGPGTYSVVIRMRAVTSVVGSFTSTSSFTVSN